MPLKLINPPEKKFTLNAYHVTAPSTNKRQLMSDWMQGVAACGDKHVITRGNEDGYLDPDKDFAMIWGWPTAGNVARERAFNSFLQRGGKQENMFFFEGNVLKQMESDMNFYRFPMYSIHPHESFFVSSPDLDSKVKYIQENTNVKIHDWKTDGKHILIYLNRGGGGWSHQGIDVYKWLVDTCVEIRKYTDRPIKVKDHPGRNPNKNSIDSTLNWLSLNISDFVYYHKETNNLADWSAQQIKNAWAAVVLTSTAGAVTMMQGIPTFATHEAAYIKPWSAGELKDIENPNLEVDREEFLRYYAGSHWSMEEVMRGDLWRELRNIRGYGND